MGFSVATPLNRLRIEKMPQALELLNTSIWPTVVMIFVLIFISAFFSGSETALTVASRGKLRSQADRGDRPAMRALRLTQNPERLIGSVLLGNNLVNILAAALATSLFARLYGDSGVALATLVMTMLILVFAEILPKTYAITKPESAARAVSAPINLFVALFFPIIGIIQFLINKLLGVRSLPESIFAVHDEIAGTIALGHSTGVVKREHRDRLMGALDLGSRSVEEIMVHRSEMELVNAEASTAEIIRKCTESQFTRLPVYRGETDNIVGVVHVKDLLRKVSELLQAKAGGNAFDKTESILLEVARKPYFVPETTPLDNQMREFRRLHSHFALVVDEYGALQGLITLEDILEEIVGDISDEHDEDPNVPMKVGDDGTLLVEGSTPVRDINREMDWNLPDDLATTIAGLVIHEAQSIPTIGQVFIFHGFRIEIVGREANRITRIRVRNL